MGLIIRQLLSTDRPEVEKILKASEAFTKEEIKVALEVLDDGLLGGIDGGYALFAVEIEDKVSGFVCIGETPLTASTWHLYWICIHPAAQGIGAGRALQGHAEEFVRSRGGERLVLETSSQESYARTRRFYQKAGYLEVGRISDFYKPGDDCLIYCKQL